MDKCSARKVKGVEKFQPNFVHKLLTFKEQSLWGENIPRTHTGGGRNGWYFKNMQKCSILVSNIQFSGIAVVDSATLYVVKVLFQPLMTSERNLRDGEGWE